MMAKLPIPNRPETMGVWAEQLNTWLQESHNEDGTLKSSAVQTEVSAAIAADQTVVDAAAAAVDASPAIATINTELTRRETAPIIDLTHPRWGAAADGVTDDYAAIMAAYAALDGRGGTIHLGGRMYFSSQTLTFTSPVTIDGGSAALDGELIQGGGIEFAPGVSGILFDVGSARWCLRDITIRSRSTGPGDDVGVRTRSGRWRMDHVTVLRFGSHGFWCDGHIPSGYNANLGEASRLTVRLNQGNGVHMAGGDANVCTFIALDAMQNTGYGVFDDGVKNSWRSPHFNANTAGAMYLSGPAPFIDGVYSEGGGPIYLDNDSYHGYLSTGGLFAPPEIWSGPAGAMVKSTAAANLRGWSIQRNNAWAGIIRMTRDDESSEWHMRLDRGAGHTFTLRNETTAQDLMAIRSDTTVPAAIGFLGKTPSTQRPASADTSGATLAQLEAEVNKLKAILRAFGFMAT